MVHMYSNMHASMFGHLETTRFAKATNDFSGWIVLVLATQVPKCLCKNTPAKILVCFVKQSELGPYPKDIGNLDRKLGGIQCMG